MNLDQWRAYTCSNFELGHWIQALLHRRAGRLTESLKFFKLCHVIDAENPDVLKQIAKTLYFGIFMIFRMLVGRFKTATKVANDALEKSPNDWVLLIV